MKKEIHTKALSENPPVDTEVGLSVLKSILSEQTNDSSELDIRWKKKFDPFFTFLTDAASRFFVSRVKSEELAQTQSYIRSVFRKTNYIEKIKCDSSLQNAFLLGYCHSTDKMIDSFETETSFQHNDSLKAAISSYKYIEPILRILDNDFEISHKELANRLEIKEPALSNFMNKVEKYHIFNSTRVGKNKYYSLAYPNGEEALKIIKEDHKFSADSYTEFLKLLMDSLKKISIEESPQFDPLEKCKQMIRQYTTEPAVCIKKLNDLALISKSERIYRSSLIRYEMNVKKKVTVFTKDIRGAQYFSDVIIQNLQNNIEYHWFIIETRQFASEEKVSNFFSEQFSALKGGNQRSIPSCNAYYHFIPKEKKEDLFGNIYDAVIYDENEGFSCIDKTLSEVTPYIEMERNTLDKFNQYVRDQSSHAHSLALA